jgi:NAD(P)-dependent dehydrogenase (short-subunit alcohol dehydrogenase family)
VLQYKHYESNLNTKGSNEMDNLLSGKTALITGAGRNIGKSIAIEMAKQGANIFYTDISQEKCTSLERELNVYPIVSEGFLSDISKPESIDSLFGFLLKNQIKIDILVNNVGFQSETTTIKKLNLEEWYKVFDTNVFGPMYLTKLISQMMIDNQIQGSIIFITSIHQWTISRLQSYSTSKAALGMIIKELALDLASHKIRVNGIAPGYIEEDEKGKPIIHRYTPLYNSSINPCYIGRAAVYLSSDYFSKFTTGTVLKIDAGLSLYNHLSEQIPLK